MKAIRRALGSDHERSLAFHLHRYAAGGRDGRSLDTIHASDVTKPNWCPRRHALLLETNTPPPTEFLGTATNLAWEMSSSLARIITEWAAGAGIARGDWLCRKCKTLHGYGPRPKNCSVCRGIVFSYEEHRFTSSVSGISGGIDLCISLPAYKKHRVVELKGLAKDGFLKTKKPAKEHDERTNLYLRLIAESEDPAAALIDTQRATVFYTTKGGFGVKTDTHAWGIRDQPWSPFKEYPIKRDDTVTQAITDLAAPLLAYLKGGDVPTGVCKSKFDSIAQVCPMLDACFGKAAT